MQTQVVTRKLELAATRVEAAYALVEKLNKKAEKLGCPPVVMTETGSLTVNAEGEFGVDRKVEIELTCATVGLGYTFVAAIDHRHDPDGNRVNILNGPGLEGGLPDVYRTSAPACDYCKTNRNRKMTYLVLDLDGKVMEVGSDCVKDALGVDPMQLMWPFGFVDDVMGTLGDDDSYGGGHAQIEYDYNSILRIAAKVTKRLGFLGTAKAREEGGKPTVEHVKDLITPGSKLNIALADPMEYTADEVALADATAAWLKEMVPHSDFEAKLVSLAQLQYVYLKDFGVLASAPSAYLRQEARKAEKAALAGSQFVGKVGDKITAPHAKVTFVHYISGNYGMTTLLKFATEDGNVLTTFYSGNEDFKLGQVVNLTGMVKKQETYQGVQQTVLTRIRTVSDEYLAAEKVKVDRKAAKLAKQAVLA